MQPPQAALDPLCAPPRELQSAVVARETTASVLRLPKGVAGPAWVPAYWTARPRALRAPHSTRSGFVPRLPPSVRQKSGRLRIVGLLRSWEYGPLLLVCCTLLLGETT